MAKQMMFGATVVFAAVVTLLLGLTRTECAAAQPCPQGWDLSFAAQGFNNQIFDSVVFDDGSGPALYVAGWFNEIEGIPIAGIAKWDGRHWSEVGGGLHHSDNYPALGDTLTVWDDGNGPALYVGGYFEVAGTTSAYNIARWDGHNWTALGTGINGSVWDLTTFDDGRGPALYAGGGFGTAGGVSASDVARWDGAEWEALGDGIGPDQGRSVQSFAVFDDGNGEALYVGGTFIRAGGQSINYLARWNGKQWSALPGVNLEPIDGSYYSSIVEELMVYDNGTGPALYMTGNFEQPSVGECFLKWDGMSISVPAKVHNRQSYPQTMAVYDDGTGPHLWIAGGSFDINTRYQPTNIARLDGSVLVAPDSSPWSWINSLISFNDGFGNALYTGGELISLYPAGQPLDNIIRWTTPHMTLHYSPLHAGQPAEFQTTCSTPGKRINFAYSTHGLGSYYVAQLGLTLDLNHPRLAGHAIADAQGQATLVRTLPPDSAGITIDMQAAEVGRKSEVVEATIE